MGKSYAHDDDETDLAADEFYQAILNCRRDEIPVTKIVQAMTAELHGLTDEMIDELAP